MTGHLGEKLSSFTPLIILAKKLRVRIKRL